MMDIPASKAKKSITVSKKKTSNDKKSKNKKRPACVHHRTQFPPL